MNYSMQKLFDDFIKKIGSGDMKSLEGMSGDVAFNYVYFLYNKFYEAYPTGEMYEALQNRFARSLAA